MNKQVKNLIDRINVTVLCLSLVAIIMTVASAYSDMHNRLQTVENEYKDAKNKISSLDDEIDNLRVKLAEKEMTETKIGPLSLAEIPNLEESQNV